MIYLEKDGLVYQTVDRTVADAMGCPMEEFGENSLHFDFGGVLVGGMETIDIQIDECQYSFFAHHLPNVAAALSAGLLRDDEFVTFNGYPFSYALTRKHAQRILHVIAQDYNKYIALELHNRHRYEVAVQALAGLPGVNVQRELDSLKKAEVH